MRTLLRMSSYLLQAVITCTLHSDIAVLHAAGIASLVSFCTSFCSNGAMGSGMFVQRRMASILLNGDMIGTENVRGDLPPLVLWCGDVYWLSR